MLRSELTIALQAASDRVLGGLLLAVSTFVFAYYTTWALITVSLVRLDVINSSSQNLFPAAISIRFNHTDVLSSSGLGYQVTSYCPCPRSWCRRNIRRISDAKGSSEKESK